MKIRRRFFRAAALLVCAPAAAFAQALVDPTRPPATASAIESTQEAVRGPVLQSIMIGPHSRAAIISGQRVELGGRFGDARVAAISESEVVLRSNSGVDVLKLYPDVHMKKPNGANATARKPARERN
jgi:MSHA biogenesis protein MshK